MKRPFQQRNTEGCAQQTAQLMDQTLQRRMDCRRVECLHTADILCADLSINTNNSQSDFQLVQIRKNYTPNRGTGTPD